MSVNSSQLLRSWAREGCKSFSGPIIFTVIRGIRANSGSVCEVLSRILKVLSGRQCALSSCFDNFVGVCDFAIGESLIPSGMRTSASIAMMATTTRILRRTGLGRVELDAAVELLGYKTGSIQYGTVASRFQGAHRSHRTPRSLVGGV